MLESEESYRRAVEDYRRAKTRAEEAEALNERIRVTIRKLFEVYKLEK